MSGQKSNCIRSHVGFYLNFDTRLIFYSVKKNLMLSYFDPSFLKWRTKISVYIFCIIMCTYHIDPTFLVNEEVF